MKVYTYSEARQRLACSMRLAREARSASDGETDPSSPCVPFVPVAHLSMSRASIPVSVAMRFWMPFESRARRLRAWGLPNERFRLREHRPDLTAVGRYGYDGRSRTENTLDVTPGFQMRKIVRTSTVALL